MGGALYGWGAAAVFTFTSVLMAIVWLAMSMTPPRLSGLSCDLPAGWQGDASRLSAALRCKEYVKPW